MKGKISNLYKENLQKFGDYFFRDISLFKRIIAFFTLAMVFVLVIFSITIYKNLSNYMVDEIIIDDANINSLLIAQINNVMSFSEELSKQIIGHQTIQDRLNTRNTNEQESLYIDINKNKAINETLYRYANNSMIDFIVISGKDGKQYSSSAEHITYTINSKPLLTRIDKSKGEIIWSISNNDIFAINNEKIYIYAIRKINSLDNPGSVNGVLFIRLNSNFINDVISKRIPKGNDYYEVLDENNIIINNTIDSSVIGSECNADVTAAIAAGNRDWFYLKNKEKFTVTFKKITNNGWTLIHYIPNKYVFDKILNLRYILVVIGLLSLLVAFGLSVVLSGTIIKPVRTLRNAIKQYGKKGTFDKGMLKARSDEIGDLQGEFEKMTERIAELMDRMQNDQKNKMRMEFQIKEYQINPHFLYNTLDAVNWMANQSGHTEIGKMVTYLARFFRISLSKGNEIYTIREEIELVKYYMLICSMRYGGGIKFETRLAEEVLDLKTIKLILQPIIENAIKHGIDKLEGNGFIIIAGYIKEDKVVLTVEDNGKGMDEETVENLNWMFTQPESNYPKEGGFGLLNVNERIRLYFGKDYGLRIVSKLGKGTSVEMSLPLLKQDKKI